jgi:hypothetical protein
VLPVGWLFVAVVAAILVTMWVTFTLTRLDRLHARVDAAWAALDAQLVRRAAALVHAAESPDTRFSDETRARFERAGARALAESGEHQRAEAENVVSRSVAEALAGDELDARSRDELGDTAARVLIARRFYNDATRDTRSLRARRMPRLLHLAGHRAMPTFFDIDDTVPSG